MKLTALRVMNLFLVLTYFGYIFALTAVKDSLHNTTSAIVQTIELKEKHVLLINSYHPGYAWSDNVVQGLRDGFDSKNNKIDLSVEYLDTRRFPMESTLEIAAHNIAVKYANYDLDVIVVSDNAAYDFVLKYREKLFPEVPIVFCGYNFFRPEKFAGQKNITGVNEEINFPEAIATALHIYPATETLIFILSTGDASSKRIAEVAEAFVLEKFNKNYQIIILKNATTTDIHQKLDKLTAKSVVFLWGQVTDIGHGRELLPTENGQIVSSICSLPVFTLWDFHLGTGVLGGNIITGTDQGLTAAKLTLQILNGTKADNIPVVMLTPFRKVFDYNVMKKFILPRNRLPKGSIIINQPTSVLYVYRYQIIGLILLIILQTLLIMALIKAFRQRRKAIKALQLEQALLETTVSERTAELRQVNESLVFTQYVVDKMNDSAFWLLENGKVVYVNEAACAKLGYTNAELLNLDVTDVVNNYSLEQWAQYWADLKTSGFIHSESRHKKKNGEIIPVEININLLHYKGTDYACGIARDITERMLAVQKLKESEEQVRLKLNSILKPDGDISLLSLAEIIDIPAIQSLLDEFCKITNIAVAIIDVDGNVLVGNGWQDICTRYHRVNSESYKNCIESDIVLSQGVSKGEFKMYKCKNNMWDVSTPIVIGGKHMGNIFTGQFFFLEEEIDLKTFREQAIKYGFNEQEYMDSLAKVPRFSKEKVNIVMTFYTLMANMISDLSYSNIKLAQTLTKQKQTEQELLQINEQARDLATKAEAANKAKTDFLANMSHEIRTPLNSVIGFSDLLKNTTLNVLQKQYVEYTNTSAKSLLAIVNDILDFSKIEAGKLELDQVKTDIIQLVEQVTDIIKHAADSKGLNLRLNVQSNLPRFALVDPIRLSQILVNLLSNAVKFTNSGEVELQVSFQETAIQDKKGVYTFSIRDTGIGISLEQQSSLFNAFTQADSSFTRRYGGTGLGLSISNQLADKMGSKIQIQSTPGQGSTFFFGLNTNFYQDESHNSSQDSFESNFTITGPPIILIAEDVSTNMILIINSLKQIIPNAVIIEANDGLEALNLIKKQKPDLILMDIQMPNMDGLTATKEIRALEHDSTGHIPIIALSAGVIKEEREKTIQAGMDEFLPKPLDKVLLTRFLQKYLKEPLTQPHEISSSIEVDANNHFNKMELLKKLGIDDKNFAALKGITRSDMEQYLSNLHEAINSNDQKKISKALHTIKGISLNMGFTELTSMIKTFTQQLDSDPETLKVLYEKLTEEWNVVEGLL